MEFTEKMKSAGLKATPQRRFIYGVVVELAHASVEEIIEKVRQEDPNLMLSTIYRILNSFWEGGVLSKINHPNGKTYYDINTTEHHHFITEQQTLVDIDDSELTEIIRQRILAKLPEGERIDRVSIQVMTSAKN